MTLCRTWGVREQCSYRLQCASVHKGACANWWVLGARPLSEGNGNEKMKDKLVWGRAGRGRWSLEGRVESREGKMNAGGELDWCGASSLRLGDIAKCRLEVLEPRCVVLAGQSIKMCLWSSAAIASFFVSILPLAPMVFSWVGLLSTEGVRDCSCTPSLKPTQSSHSHTHAHNMAMVGIFFDGGMMEVKIVRKE